MNDKYITVTQLTKYIKYKIDNDVHLNEVFLKGEISNFKAHSRGHFYFTLKDEGSRINAIMFASSTRNIKFIPQDGMKVLVTGKISVFEANGGYQIYVNDMLEDGVGNLYIAYETGTVDYYPKETMDKLAAFFGINVFDLLDDYNRFQYNGQGRAISESRRLMGLSKKAYARMLGIDSRTLDNWEKDKKRMNKNSWEKYFKDMLK
jgi:DNA-binding XRE family transcriptional regulator